MLRRFVMPALVTWFLLPGLAIRAADKPNILLLFADDQRADTIAALGNRHITTPALDGLVQRGTVFNRAYCMGSQQGAVCVPSRAMLMTGRTLFRIKENLEGQQTWPEMFAQSGYSTFITGKWHNGAESVVRVFQQGKAIFLGGMGDPFKLPLQDISAEHKLENKHESGEHSVKCFADAAIDFIQQSTAGQPFLCYVAFNGPHDPRVAPQKYQEKYNAQQPPLPPNFLPVHPFNNGALTIRDEALAPWPRTSEIVRQHLADYYAYVEFMDDQIGRILNSLKESGRLENTIIVFSSDHGLAIGSHGLFGKQNLYEHSMRSPLMIAGPGIPKGQQTSAMCYLLDIFPTLGELAGVSAPSGSEGRSLTPVLVDPTKTYRSCILTAYANTQRAIRDDRWKLVVFPQINKTQLFDLQSDPDEMHDLSNDPKHKQELARLTALLREQQQDASDRQNLTTDHPESADFDFTKLKK